MADNEAEIDYQHGGRLMANNGKRVAGNEAEINCLGPWTVCLPWVMYTVYSRSDGA